MEFHALPDDIGDFMKLAVVFFKEGMHDTPLYGLKAVLKIGNSPVFYNIGSVLKKIAVENGFYECHALLYIKCNEQVNDCKGFVQFSIMYYPVIMYSVGIAYLLWLISGFGALGFHRFYLGKIFTGLLWFFTGGLGMIGAIYDLITLPAQVMEANIRRAYYENIVNERNNNNYKPSWRNVDDGETHIVHDKDND